VFYYRCNGDRNVKKEFIQQSKLRESKIKMGQGIKTSRQKHPAI
jgi:hypothetical protein